MIPLFIPWSAHKHPSRIHNGLLVAIFFTLVFGLRFLIEFLKERQVDFENQMALNGEQWLSLPFIIAGLTYLIYIYTKKQLITKENGYV